MFPQQLGPNLELLRKEYVLVQAWKKTASFIRYHNWFSDTLDLDQTALNLPTFLGEIGERLQSSEPWQNDPLRLVPAPKSQCWRVRNDRWKPVGKESVAKRIRPLAHVSLADQVVATALMLCLANRVETQQGDPRLCIRSSETRKQVISYGNRLFCDRKKQGELHHRWGSARLYRAYFQDYRKFLSRPKVVAKSDQTANRGHVYVVHADLSQFYDRVHPGNLAKAIRECLRPEVDEGFFNLAKTLLNWGWNASDERDVRTYANDANLEDFTRVALPQGLVASGFFANLSLRSFDEALKVKIGCEIEQGVRLKDICRYVDDFRILVEVDKNSKPCSKELGCTVSCWLNQVLKKYAYGLTLSCEKTQAVRLDGDKRILVPQSEKMDRIQSEVSGGFDALAGEAILDAIHGLMHAQEALRLGDGSGWEFSPVPDVEDSTVARFSANRYRTTFRSIRPLLLNEGDSENAADCEGKASFSPRNRAGRTRGELDKDARVFAQSLIKLWVEDPSKVRLLLIGLDLWPDVEVLRRVIALLRPFTKNGNWAFGKREIAWYCLAEVLRAGAVETGLVPDTESLPSGICLESYRCELGREAARLAALPEPTIPWYLRQQALLFLAAHDPAAAPKKPTSIGQEMRLYWRLVQFLRGGLQPRRESDFALLAVLARRTFLDRETAVCLALPGLSQPRTRHDVAQRDPSFLLEIINSEADACSSCELPPRIREDLCRGEGGIACGQENLAAAVLESHPGGQLRNELSLLRFAKAFLESWDQKEHSLYVITPENVTFGIDKNQSVAEIENLQIRRSLVGTSGSLYEVADWCPDGEQWRFQLGFLLRFILSGHPDFTRPVRGPNWRESESSYRPAESHWYQRKYGLFSGQPAFGDDWLPISEWVEGFLLGLLRWPGCLAPQQFDWVEQGIETAKTQICGRIVLLEQLRGKTTGELILPLQAKRPSTLSLERPLRACVVQTAVPSTCDFKSIDLALNKPETRRRHRNHLSSALAAVERMLVLRKTHRTVTGQLDWLILPELAVHPQDVKTHLIPFARLHRTMILAGLTYEEILPGQPLVNSALWVIPEWSEDNGLQIRTRRQGKKHLAPDEDQRNKDKCLLQGFRPCQWIVGYPWSVTNDTCRVRLTAVVCYDATDLGIVADLKGKSDILAIPAFNKDVKTFDQMALALHYHMYQIVVVANSGQYGGSNAYWPQNGPHRRQIFHTHGQAQMSIAFFDVDNIGSYLQRHKTSLSNTDGGVWKLPPAGWDPGLP